MYFLYCISALPANGPRAEDEFPTETISPRAHESTNFKAMSTKFQSGEARKYVLSNE